ncbi:MAG: tetratricopeptide repeat protein [Verrucomicrobiota bacterium]
MSRPRLIALLLALTTLIVFLPAGQFSFLNYDDNDYVSDNPHVKTGLTPAGVKWAFTAFHAGNWHPLTWISHMADCTLFGLNPGAHHFVNVLFHAANATLLFGLLLRLTERMWPSALVAALFAWHPLHVESVAWISERKDVLSTFFALLTLLSYAKFARQNCRRSYWLALVFFALGLLAKPMLVTLPFVLLLLDYWPLQRFSFSNFRRRVWIEKNPFFALTGISCVITFLAQKDCEAVVSLADISLRYRLENAPVAVVNYLLNFFAPVNLAAIYPMPAKISALQITLSTTVLALLFLTAWRGRNIRPYFRVGWLWFVGTLIPVIGIVQVGSAAMADRYTYLPSVGFFIAVIFLAADLAAQFHTPKILITAMAGALLAACIFATEFQLQFWRDSETLFRRTAAVTQNNDVALVNLGVALELQNRQTEALAIYRQAEKLGPGRYQLHTNLGNLLAKMNQHAEALAEFREALRRRPGNAKLQNFIGIELAALGRSNEALTAFTEAETFDPQYVWPHVEAAKTLFKLGRDAEALAELRTALRMAPDNFQILTTAAYYMAANENGAARDAKFAILLGSKANLLAGGNQPSVFDALGIACAANGDFTNAQICVENALTLANAAKMKNLEPLQKRLLLYRNRQPWRESFRATNAPAGN